MNPVTYNVAYPGHDDLKLIVTETRIPHLPMEKEFKDSVAICTKDQKYAVFVTKGNSCQVSLYDIDNAIFSANVFEIGVQSARIDLHRTSDPDIILIVSLNPEPFIAVFYVTRIHADLVPIMKGSRGLSSFYIDDTLIMIVQTTVILEVTITFPNLQVSFNPADIRSYDGDIKAHSIGYNSDTHSVQFYNPLDRIMTTMPISDECGHSRDFIQLPESSICFLIEDAPPNTSINWSFQPMPHESCGLAIYSCYTPGFCCAFNDSQGLLIIRQIGEEYRISYVMFRAERPPSPPKITLLSRSLAAATLGPVFRAPFITEASLILQNSRHCTSYSIPVQLSAENPVIVQFPVNSGTVYSASLRLLNVIQSESVDIWIPEKERPLECQDFSVKSIETNILLFTWRPPPLFGEEKIAHYLIEGGLAESGEFTPLFQVFDPEAIGIKARVDPTFTAFRLRAVDSELRCGPPVIAKMSLGEDDDQRIIWSNAQKKALLESFEKDPKPRRADRELIANEIGASAKSVTNWFRNARKAQKRLAL
jgi:hypothetical protein